MTEREREQMLANRQEEMTERQTRFNDMPRTKEGTYGGGQTRRNDCETDTIQRQRENKWRWTDKKK